MTIPTESDSSNASQGRRRARPSAFTVITLLVAVVAVGATWLRLFVGMDLQDESFYVLVPWRWVLGDKPFVAQQDLFQIPGFLSYPFVKLFAVLRGNDPTGLMLYTRHLYLLLMLAVAAVVFLLLRRLVRWQLALLVASAYVTYIFWATPQLSYNTMALAFLTIGAALGAMVVVNGKGRRYALGSGVAFGLAVVAYPTLLFIMPFYAVLLVFAQGNRGATMLAQGSFRDPGPEQQPSGRAAWRILSAWVLGGMVILVPVGLLLLSFGPGNLLRSYQSTMAGARVNRQLGGAAKAIAVAQGYWRLFTWRSYLIVAALLIYFVYRRWPRLGAALLATLPVALWLAAQRPVLWASGYAQVYGFMAPYLFLFVPREKRVLGAKLLIWVWAPAVIAGAMTAYTSAAAYVNTPVGLAPALMVSGLFLVWALETVARAPGEREAVRLATDDPARVTAPAERRSTPWLALGVLVALVAVSLSFQLQFQQRDVPLKELTSRFASGPWWGIKVTPARRQEMNQFAADLKANARPGDKLLIFFGGAGFYLYWNGSVASNSTWVSEDPATHDLARETFRYFRRRSVVPTLAVRSMSTRGHTQAQLEKLGGGLGYPVVLVRPEYVFYRKPPGMTTAQVLARLSR